MRAMFANDTLDLMYTVYHFVVEAEVFGQDKAVDLEDENCSVSGARQQCFARCSIVDVLDNEGLQTCKLHGAYKN